MLKVLKEFLEALQKVKDLKDNEGGSYACFGVYDERNETCSHQYNQICRVCKKLHTIASDDWIEEEMKKRR